MALVTATTTVEVGLLLLAFVLSAVIGLERQARSKSAGLRTHTLVGLGSAIFTLVSGYGFQAVTSADAIVDPSRIAAQVVSGIGFLGAGVIFVRRSSVSGLTTAASIWVTAAIGMACGAGMAVIALVGTTLHLVTVLLLTMFGRRLRRRRGREAALTVRYRDGQGALREILAASTELGYETSLLSVSESERPTGPTRIEAELRFTGAPVERLDDLVERLASVPGVTKVQRRGRPAAA